MGYKIMNNTQRSFVVTAKPEIKNGFALNKTEIRLDPGKTIYEVDDETGKLLETYEGIVVVEKPKNSNTNKKKPTKSTEPGPLLGQKTPDEDAELGAEDDNEDETDLNPDGTKKELNPDGTPKKVE